jgi:hypothetical protein
MLFGSEVRHGEVMRSGRTRYGTQVLQVPAVDREGRSLSIAFTVTMLREPDGTVQAIAAIIRDDTGRWQEERALRRRLAELEARREEAAESCPDAAIALED